MKHPATCTPVSLAGGMGACSRVQTSQAPAPPARVRLVGMRVPEGRCPRQLTAAVTGKCKLIRPLQRRRLACEAKVVDGLAPATSLAGVCLPRASDGEQVDLGAALAATTSKTLLVAGSHAADFNMVEYAQRVRAFWPQLQAAGVQRCLMVVNGEASACAKLAELLDLPEALELLPDPAGEAGRAFGVSRGWRPDDAGISPRVKLTLMGLGLGPPWMTLPAVGTGYLGSPGGRREWIEEALKQGQLAGRWPAVLELGPDGAVTGNRFDTFPLVGGWGRRPFELATLRLQNLLGVQMKHWDDLKPVDERCLTQLGGCTVVGPGGEPLYSWVDQGLCDVPDMQQVLAAL